LFINLATQYKAVDANNNFFHIAMTLSIMEKAFLIGSFSEDPEKARKRDSAIQANIKGGKISAETRKADQEVRLNTIRPKIEEIGKDPGKYTANGLATEVTRQWGNKKPVLPDIKTLIKFIRILEREGAIGALKLDGRAKKDRK
jgi:hypothetical protein